MPDAIDNLEERIALARRNIEDLTEQATGASGAASEERIAARISATAAQPGSPEPIWASQPAKMSVAPVERSVSLTGINAASISRIGASMLL